MVAFGLQAAVVLFAPLELTASYRLIILAFNLASSMVIGWYLYKRWYHMVFSYDKTGFILRKGRSEEVQRSWREFRKVSLTRSELGEFFVRLYEDRGNYFDIPVSKLKLDPFKFRTEIMRLVGSQES